MASQTYTDSVTLTAAAEFNKFDTAAYAALSGVAGTNTITATGPANLGLVATNPVLWFIPANTNTGATTLNITPSGGSALGAKNVFSGGSACVGGEIVSGVPTAVVYDGTQYNILGPAVTKGTQASTFTFDGSGGSTGSLTMTYQKIGSFVTLNIPVCTATSGTNSAILSSNTALPAAIRPTAIQSFAVNDVFNNGANTTDAGQGRVTTAGIIEYRRNAAADLFTNSSTCGVARAITITYCIA